MSQIKMDIVAIIGSDKLGLSDELGRLLASHKIAIIEDKQDPTRNLSIAWIQRGSKESMDNAMKEAKPLKREAKRELIRKLRSNMKSSN